MRTRTIDVDINSNSLRILRYKQYDHNNILEVFVKKNKEILDLTSYTIRVFFTLPNNKVIQKNAVFKDKKIIITIEDVLLEQHGKVPVEITMSNGNEIVTIFRMYLEVEESIDRKSAIEGSPEWDIIKDGLSVIDDKVSHTELDERLDNYYTRNEIETKLENLDVNINLDDYVKKKDLPTKTSDLINDNNFLSEIPSEYITEDELEERLRDTDVSTNVPTKTSDLINDSGFISEIPSEFITENELSEKGYLTNEKLDNYYKKSEVDNKITDIITDVEINLDEYTKKEDLNEYTKKEDLNEYTKKEDLDGKADNLFQSDMLTVSSLGGISAGTDLNNMSIQDVLTKLLYPYVAPSISASIVYSPTGGVYEFGQTVTVTQIKATVTKKSENITKVSFYRNGLLENSITSSVSDGGSFSYTFTNPISITSSISNSYFQAKVTDASGKVVSANTSALNFYYPYYYGVIGANVDITENLIKNLTKQVVSKGSKTYTYSPNYQRMVIAYPKSYGILSSILDPNGFEQLSSFTCLEKSIVGLDGTSQQYYVYINDASTNINFKMSFYY